MAHKEGADIAASVLWPGVTGQKGINLIERVVEMMESRWTRSELNEVGIDGY